MKDWKTEHTLQNIKKAIPWNSLKMERYWYKECNDSLLYKNTTSLSGSGIYVIELVIFNKEKERRFCYVGQGGNVFKRLADHFNGKGTQKIDEIIEKVKQETTLGVYKYRLRIGIIYCHYAYLNFMERYTELEFREIYNYDEMLNMVSCGTAPKLNQKIMPHWGIEDLDKKIYNSTKNDFYLWEEQGEYYGY